MTEREQQEAAEIWRRDAELAQEQAQAEAEARMKANATANAKPDVCEVTLLRDFPAYVPEEQNPEILISGRWLERGGAAFIISTAGTGKSINCLQTAMSWTEGVPFAGLKPLKKLKVWVFQSEDSKSRVAIDRDDITAELQEQHPNVDWQATAAKIPFVKFPGKVGAEFLEMLNAKLGATPEAERPDVIMLNPFLSYVGGPVTDGAYVTPFLRGGTINRLPTMGLQTILEKYHVGATIYHHTPKPPKDEKEYASWLKSSTPEYNGAGSADITNWGRSFITMLKVPGRPTMVCLTAGKNGSELGWDNIDGANRRYMAWSKSKGVTGKNRHAWRELDDDELAEITKDARDHLAEDVEKIAAALKETPQRYEDLRDTRAGLPDRRFRVAWAKLKDELQQHGLGTATAKTGKTKHVYYGTPDAAQARADTTQRNWENCRNAQH